jgi:hypothetical protein
MNNDSEGKDNDCEGIDNDREGKNNDSEELNRELNSDRTELKNDCKGIHNYRRKKMMPGIGVTFLTVTLFKNKTVFIIAVFDGRREIDDIIYQRVTGL